MASVPPASSVVSASASPGGGGGFGHHHLHQHQLHHAGHAVHYAAADAHQLQLQQQHQHQHLQQQQHLHGHATAAALASLTEVGAGGGGPGTPSSAGAGLPGGGDVEGGVEGDGEGGGDGEGDSDGVAEVEGLRAVAASAKVSRKLRQASKQRGWGWREARAEYLRLEEQRRKALGRPGGAAGASFWCYLTPVLVVDGNASAGPNGSSSPSAVLGLGLRCVCGEVHLNVSNPAKVCHDHLATAACKAITPEQRARLVNKKNKPGPPLASASAAAEQHVSPIHHIHNNAATSNHRHSAINDSPTAQDQSRPDVLPWDARERGGGKRSRAALVDGYEQQQGSAKRGSQAYVPVQVGIDNKDDELEDEAGAAVGLRAKFAGLKSCMADLEEALLEQRQQHHPQLPAAGDERTQQHIASLQARIASLEGESAQRAAEASDAVKEFAQRDAEVQRLTAVSAQLQARIERMEAARASTDDADQLASTSLVKQLASRESELQRLAAVNADLQASIQAVEAERMRDMEERMSAKAVDMVAGLKSQLFRQQRLEEGEGEIGALRHAIEELRAELRLRDQAMATLQRSLLEKESTNACLQEEVNQLRGEAAERGLRLHELEAECESLRFRLAGQTVEDATRLLETPQTRLTELEEPSAFGEGENVQVDLQ